MVNKKEGIKIKIAWLNDYKLSEFIGGCQVTNSIMIKKGREIIDGEARHEIIELTPKDFEGMELGTDNWDLVILNNINQFKPEIIDWIIKNKPYITYTHDYYFCQYRNARCKQCKSKCAPAKIFVDLYSSSLLNIFLSPLHLEIHNKFFGQTMRDAICIPSPIEEGKFYPGKNIQQDAYLYAGAIMTHKGVSQMLDFADSQKGKKIFHFAGKAIGKELMKRIKEKHTYLGEIPYEEMPKLLRKYKQFMVNAQWPEPFGRSIIEAMLSGCTLVRFSQSWKTGMESYNTSPTEMIDRCIKSPDKFWREVEKAK